jgi:hypothetical protein
MQLGGAHMNCFRAGLAKYDTKVKVLFALASLRELTERGTARQNVRRVHGT